ncbi:MULTISPECIES: sulfite exporter TauE/SafE family protein [Halocynthiibacter]|uniref:Probable membrane transporter protein n=1 Tax=Halocynthiibacter halioticoli TaxID=2986804 RepID=A0AAE3IWN8_9RHOB|nr:MULTISPECIES: sulfite exporter TauE/SafE family protein [Halocynthiibacter]MCV6823597.1 sulfite exporter TauE/SafE family protein [Halocynthiibacter halioticoli]MCW4056598.1 sulfite exporter TauE/SafE family protein [Halocynthiibacter sp. SDUM655004]MDE0590385.1 sulfite exporter TauE/SafE family protein [Halocynthiibacter sp. C4]
MEFDLVFFAFAIPAVLFAGISKGGFGSGAAFAATPFLALILEPGQAVGLMLPLLMLMDIGALKAFWKQWNWDDAKLMILGSLPGILLGAALYSVANPDVFKFLIGLVAVGFVAYTAARSSGLLKTAEKPLPRAAGAIAGAVAGFTSFISHAGGPPAAVYLLSKKMSKTEFQATTVIIFWAINLIKFVPYLMLGIFSKETAIANVLLAPVAFLGVYLGVIGHRKMPETWFFRLTYAFLLITGCKLIWESLT